MLIKKAGISEIGINLDEISFSSKDEESKDEKYVLEKIIKELEEEGYSFDETNILYQRPERGSGISSQKIWFENQLNLDFREAKKRKRI